MFSVKLTRVKKYSNILSQYLYWVISFTKLQYMIVHRIDIKNPHWLAK